MSDEPIEVEPVAQALVILPFLTAQQAEQFAVLVMAQFGSEFQAPIVTLGTAYTWKDEEGALGQVFELFPGAHWDAYIKDGNERHHVLQRVTAEVSDERQAPL
jgi:hypothetical protein